MLCAPLSLFIHVYMFDIVFALSNLFLLHFLYYRTLFVSSPSLIYVQFGCIFSYLLNINFSLCIVSVLCVVSLYTFCLLHVLLCFVCLLLLLCMFCYVLLSVLAHCVML